MATATVTRLWRPETRQESGWVEAIEDESIVVDLGTKRARARRARSCLVAPSVGDLVLVATMSTGEAFVWAVLEGARREVSIELGSDADLVVEGRLRMTASEGVEIVTPSAASITSSELHVETRLARFAFDAVTAIGASLRTEVSRLSTIADSIETLGERIVQYVKDSRRVVTGLDQLRAEQIDHRADQTLSLQAKHAFVSADTLAKIDGEQVHIG
jgi:hypothetical protein